MPAKRSGKFQHPSIVRLDLLSLEAGEISQLLASKHHEGVRFECLDVSEEDLTGVTFSECEFDGLVANDTQLQGARIVETKLTQVIAPTLRARRSTWNGVELSSSRLGAIEAYDPQFSQVCFEGSKLGWLNLRASKLQDAVFRGCRIDELDLSDATLHRVAFEDCAVDTLTLNGTRSKPLGLRGLQFSRIEGVEGMRGSRITEQQAIELLSIFAGHLGIEIAG